ncbi:MAG: ABC transporter permease [SAR202 cluster bacterium]|nr:ABC transporter permease [SAR202 cluster bacterium]
MAQKTRDESADFIRGPGFFARLRISVLWRYPVLPVLILLALLITGIFSPLIEPKDPFTQSLRARNAAPAWNSQWYEEHPRVELRYLLGADHVGRDVLSRIMRGAQISLMVVVVALGAGTVIGTSLGLLAGYFRGPIDEAIMRIWDMWAAIPFLLIALVIATVIGNSIPIVMGLLAMVSWSAFVPNVRAEVLSLKERDYISNARIAGASSRRIIFRHILPNVLNTVVVIATLRIGGLILAEASLGFLGVGIPKPTPTWGNMINDGREYLSSAWWISFFPGLAIFLVVMSLNFFGDWLRDRWDPRLRQAG